MCHYCDNYDGDYSWNFNIYCSKECIEATRAHYIKSCEEKIDTLKQKLFYAECDLKRIKYGEIKFIGFSNTDK
jgi:hypothetical protein